ncbi:phosphoribosylglycinamide formyltransferase [candidate division KSB1 bacterium]|nr:phosphoribosylglycinamide formyltransferase [candidate division KSB1 bacterium]
MSKALKLTVLVSGRGSNLMAVLEKIDAGKLNAVVTCVISNRSAAGGLISARERGIPTFHLSPSHYPNEPDYEKALLATLEAAGTELIVLAGYLKILPQTVVRTYKNRILNIHPALLPSFGGKGMFGHHVHEAVLAFGCKVSGATVHLVDEKYDTGPPVLQECVPVHEDDTPDSLAARVLALEHRLLPEAIGLFAENRIRIENRRVIIKT